MGSVVKPEPFQSTLVDGFLLSNNFYLVFRICNDSRVSPINMSIKLIKFVHISTWFLDPNFPISYIYTWFLGSVMTPESLQSTWAGRSLLYILLSKIQFYYYFGPGQIEFSSKLKSWNFDIKQLMTIFFFHLVVDLLLQV